MSDYGLVHDGKVFTPNGTPDVALEQNDERNTAIENAELAHWQTKPERMLAYYALPAIAGNPDRKYLSTFRIGDLRNAVVTTWRGKTLGRITCARVYLHNFGSRFVALTVTGNNGANYHGRASYDWGTCINLRKYKE